MIAANKALMTAYDVNQNFAAGMQPCNHPEEHVYWDSAHFTTAVHIIIFNKLLDYILLDY
jgi:hypothetical protein